MACIGAPIACRLTTFQGCFSLKDENSLHASTSQAESKPVLIASLVSPASLTSLDSDSEQPVGTTRKMDNSVTGDVKGAEGSIGR